MLVQAFMFSTQISHLSDIVLDLEHGGHRFLNLSTVGCTDASFAGRTVHEAENDTGSGPFHSYFLPDAIHVEHVITVKPHRGLLPQSGTVTNAAVVFSIDSFLEGHLAGRTLSFVHLLDAFFLQTRQT